MNKFKSLKDLLENQYETSVGQSNRSSKRFNADAFDFLQLVKEWPEIVGPRMANITIPLKVQSKSLVILSSHGAISEQLSFMSEVILEKVKARFPALSHSIFQIKFMTNPAHFQEQKLRAEKQQEKKVKEIEELTHKYSPNDQALLKKANDLFNELEDEDIKKSLTSIFIQLHKS